MQENKIDTNEIIGTKRLRMRLSSKLMVITTTLLAVAVLTLGIISINLGSSAIIKKSNTDAIQYTTEGAAHVGSIISGNMKILGELTEKAGVDTMDFNTQVVALSNKVSALGYQDIAVMNMSGHAKYVVGGGEFDAAGQFWYEAGFNGETAISDVAVSKVTLEPVVFDVAPIRSNGQVVGLLVGRRDPTFLKDTTNALGDGDRKYGFVVGSEGGFMAHPDDKNVLEQVNVFADMENNGMWKSFGESLKQLGAGQTEILEYDLNGETKIGASAPVPNTTWSLVVAEYESDVLAPMVTLRNIILLVSLAILLIGGGITYILAKRISAPVIKLKEVADKLALGDIDVDVKATTNDEIGELMDSFGFMIENTKRQARVAQSLAEGDFTAEITPQSDKDVLSLSMIAVITEMNKLYDGIIATDTAVTEGRLNYRGNTNDYSGAYKQIIVGLNGVINAFTKPIKVASKAIERIGTGIIPPKITTDYNGDFNELKTNINACIDGLGALTEGSHVLGLMNDNDYSQKMDGTYLGIYSEIANSINGVHHQLGLIVTLSTNIAKGDLKDLEGLRKTGKKSDNDTLIPSLIQMIENIVMLIDETNIMARSAIDGDLNHRGDVSRFSGDYIKVIEGFNQTLDVVIEPVKEASSVLKELAQGNLNTLMVGDFKGHHGKIKEDMNQTVQFLRSYVEEITTTLEKVGEGDLSQEISRHYLGDFVSIKTAINSITTRLSEVMSDINNSAGQVEVGARQISEGGQMLAQGTTEQASAIQELTASIEEVAQETKRNAVNANDANAIAIDVRSNAEKGNVQMGKMVTAMVEINDSSKSISKIIKVIDDIAFQTNILALNAAVEAARAGQHGKGFAVVAEEVRSLAARSAEAAKETTGLIEGSIGKVEVGTKIADETAVSLKEILEQIEKVTGLVSKIAIASNDQASEIAQITLGIEQVSMVVQSNSATAEESAAASEELSGQAEMLKDMVDAFKIKN